MVTNFEESLQKIWIMASKNYKSVERVRAFFDINSSISNEKLEVNEESCTRKFSLVIPAVPSSEIKIRRFNTPSNVNTCN